MLSINTNLSSLITQTSMNSATAKLNQAVERMTTGAKINHAKDNAANYSISTNMTTKINSYMVAEDNVAMGLDMVTTASSTLDLVSEHVQRIRNLCEQASNGTYGEQSLKAINSEANARIDEIERLFNTAEYNGINLSKGKILHSEDSKFIKEIRRKDTSGMQTLSSVDISQPLVDGIYSISSSDELAKLATMTNNGLIGANTEFVLAKDIDLGDWCNTNSATGGWVTIGDLTNPFKAVFDGNGYVISNLKIDRDDYYQGLFGKIEFAEVKNLGMIDSNIDNTAGATCGIISAAASSAKIDNCYVLSSSLVSVSNAGLICGNVSGTVFTNCYSSGEVGLTHPGNVGRSGGIAGTIARGSVVNNCFSTAKILDSEIQKGAAGLVGCSYSGVNIVKNSVYTDPTNSIAKTLVGVLSDSTVVIENCATNDLTKSFVGGVENSTYLDSNVTEILDISERFKLDKKIVTCDSLINLQVGINSNDSSNIDFNLGYFLEDFALLRNVGLDSGGYLEQIDKMLSVVSNKQTEYGAVQNRLESCLEEISVQYDNLVSSRSTLRDADIAKESSKYIQAQILQQASATLMATANQSPSIALQLI